MKTDLPGLCPLVLKPAQSGQLNLILGCFGVIVVISAILFLYSF